MRVQFFKHSRWELALGLFFSLFILYGCQEQKEIQPKSGLGSKDNPPSKNVIITSPGTDLLKDPQGEKIFWLPGGEEVLVIESSPQMVEYNSRKNFWYKVRTKSGREGWIWGDDFSFASENSVTMGNIPAKGDLDKLTYQELIDKGNTFLQNEQPTEALKYFEKSVQLSPNDSLGLFLLALTYQQIGEDEKAIEPYQRAVKLAPKDFWAHNNLGLAYIRTKQYDKAVSVLEIAITLQPPSEMYNEAEEAKTVAVRNLITAYRCCGRLEEADVIAKKFNIN